MMNPNHQITGVYDESMPPHLSGNYTVASSRMHQYPSTSANQAQPPSYFPSSGVGSSSSSSSLSQSTPASHSTCSPAAAAVATVTGAAGHHHHMSHHLMNNVSTGHRAGHMTPGGETGGQSRMIPVDGMMLASTHPDGQRAQQDQATVTGVAVENLVGEFPLQNKWSFYFLKNDHTRSWIDNLVFIGTVTTVEQFWSIMNHMHSVGRVQFNSDFMMFKEGIKPMWEDEHNRDGGRWIFSIEKRQRLVEVDSCWIHLLLNLVGDHFGDDSEFIAGAVVSARKGNDKISMWTMHRDNEAVQRRLGKLFKKYLCLPSAVTICYESHGLSQVCNGQALNSNNSTGSDRKKDIEYLYKE